MSTVKKRQQLNLDELQRMRWLLGEALALFAMWSMFYLETEAWAMTALASVLVLVVSWRPRLPAKWASWMPRVGFPAAVAFFSYELYFGGEVFAATIRLGVLLVLYKAINYRKRRDDLQLIVLGLFLVVAAGVVTVSPVFALQITAFAGCALGLLMTVNLSEAGTTKAAPAGETAPIARNAVPEWAATPDWRRFIWRVRTTSDWRLVALGAGLFGGLVALSALLFMAMPRFQMENAFPFLDRITSRSSSTGFTDTLHFGEVSDIQKDNSVAMSVEISDRSKLPAQLYWRMAVLDEYKDRTFRMSAALKSGFRREARSVRVGGTEQDDPSTLWTCYLEAGAGRWVPLLGGFRELRFTEQQYFQSSPSLRLVMLSREGPSMRAFRVMGMKASGVIPEPEFLQRMREKNERLVGHVLDLPLSEEDREKVAACVAEITGGAQLPAGEFVRKAMAWLGARHRYALQMKLGKQEGDPLVRWLVSQEPGHCELFAGSLVMLARSAGHPARLVAGFVGGTWNETFLVVKNSDAHAWCEVFDGKQSWVRYDPTIAAGGNGGDALAALTAAGAKMARGGWSDRLDRLRMFWYRRIVNFEQRDQLVMAESIKSTAENTGLRLRTTLKKWVDVLRGWLATPWNLHRLLPLVAGLGAIVALVWLLVRVRRMRGKLWSWRRGKEMDPARKAAGQWLERVSNLRETIGVSSPLWVESGDVRAHLERLRFGPSVTWPEVEKAKQSARRLQRRARIESRRHALT